MDVEPSRVAKLASLLNLLGFLASFGGLVALDGWLLGAGVWSDAWMGEARVVPAPLELLLNARVVLLASTIVACFIRRRGDTQADGPLRFAVVCSALAWLLVPMRIDLRADVFLIGCIVGYGLSLIAGVTATVLGARRRILYRWSLLAAGLPSVTGVFLGLWWLLALCVAMLAMAH